MARLKQGIAVALLAFLSTEGLAHAAGTCGDGGVEGTQEQVPFDGSLYYITTPDGYTGDTPVPLIIGLHGDEADPANSVNWFWRDVPDGSFIFVAPKAPNEGGSWYQARDSNSLWMDSLLESLKAQYNVDLDRIYIWGLSGGAVFSSRYVLTRQDVFAAANFNMGGSGGPYVAPSSPDCRIPARFVVSTTDFLRDGAMSFYDDLTAEGHETVWVDAACDDHCWGDIESEDNARDWLMAHTLCGVTPSLECDGEPVIPGDPPAGAGGGTTTNPGDPGAGATSGGVPLGGTTGSDPGSEGPGNGTGSDAGNGPGSNGDPTDDSDSDESSSDDAGCGCKTAPRPSAPSEPLIAGTLLLAAALMRRRAHSLS